MMLLVVVLITCHKLVILRDAIDWCNYVYNTRDSS